jgi:hypothetical protein
MERAGDSPPKRPVSNESARVALGVYFVILVAGTAMVLWMNRDQWFLTEDWAYFMQRRPHLLNGDFGAYLFSPYRGHWITTTNLVYEVLYRLFGLRTYVPYLLVTILGTAGCSGLIRAHLRRAKVQPWLATAIAALALFLAYGAEDVAKAWQLSFTVSLFFGLAQLIACDHDGDVDRRDAIAVGLGVLSLMTSGIGVLFIGIVGLSLALRKRWKAVVVNVAPLIAIYLAWYLAYGREGREDAERAGLHQAGTVIDLVWRALSLSIDGLTRLGGTGGVILVVVALLAIATRVPATRRGTAPIVALAVGAPAFLLLSAMIHLPSFVDLSDRYLHVSELLLLPLIGVVLDRLTKRSIVLVTAGVVLLAAAVVANGIALSDGVDGYARVTEILKPKVLAMASLPNLESFPRDAVQSEPLLLLVTVGGVERIRRDGGFPSTSSITPEQQAAVEADLGLRLLPKTDASGRSTPPAATLLSPLNASIARAEPGCIMVDESSGPQGLTLGVSEPTVLPLQTTATGQFVIRVNSSPAPSATLRSIELTPGNYELHVNLPDSELGLELPDQGSTRVCGVAT